MSLEKAFLEASINGFVIGSLVAAVMIFSNQVSDVVILRTTVAASLFRFAMYMIENVDEVSAGHIGQILDVPPKKTKGIIRNLQFGKVI